MNIPCIHATERVEDGSQLGGLRAHLRRLSHVRHTYYFTKPFQRHSQKNIVNFKLNRTSIKVISKTIDKTGGEFLILGNTARSEPRQTCISTKIIEILPNSCSFKEFIARESHCTRLICVLQQLQGHMIFVVAHPSSREIGRASC